MTEIKTLLFIVAGFAGAGLAAGLGVGVIVGALKLIDDWRWWGRPDWGTAGHDVLYTVSLMTLAATMLGVFVCLPALLAL